MSTKKKAAKRSPAKKKTARKSLKETIKSVIKSAHDLGQSLDRMKPLPKYVRKIITLRTDQRLITYTPGQRLNDSTVLGLIRENALPDFMTVKTLNTEETVNEVMKLVTVFNKPTQNSIIANILLKMQAERVNKVKELESDIQMKQALLNKAMDIHHGFEAVRKGGLEQLAFQ